MSTPHTNIKIKARCHNIERIKNILESQNAKHNGLDHQTDTYFNVHHGRLKLRKGNIENSLIFYKRGYIKEPKPLNVILYENPTTALEKILMSSLEISATVNKTREIYSIKNVKFNIDRVKGLGNFVEIEVISSNGKIKEKELMKQCKHYMDMLEIKRGDLEIGSYSDLLKKFVRH